MKGKKLDEMTFEEIKAAGLCEISKTPLKITILPLPFFIFPNAKCNVASRQ